MFLGFVAAIVMMGTCATIRATKEEAVIRVENPPGSGLGYNRKLTERRGPILRV